MPTPARRKELRELKRYHAPAVPRKDQRGPKPPKDFNDPHELGKYMKRLKKVLGE